MTSPSSDERLIGTHTILCDMGYGLPNERRPRREKVLAIARQLVNFLRWQNEQTTLTPAALDSGSVRSNLSPAQLIIVACTDVHSLEQRMIQLWTSEQPQGSVGGKVSRLPSHVHISSRSLEDWLSEFYPNRKLPPVNESDSLIVTLDTEQTSIPIEDCCYLSPDAAYSLDPCRACPPPPVIIVGMLIDRLTIQKNRSLHRAEQLQIHSARLPLERVVQWHIHEPLNVDCILECMQQWSWNVQGDATERPFEHAATQAIQHHIQRHPRRPRHALEPNDEF